MSTKAKRRHRISVLPGTAPRSSTKRIVVQFPLSLYQETAMIIDELHTTHNEFIQSAIESFLEQRKQENLEQLLEEGYTANANLARQSAEDFSFIDAAQ